MALVHLWGSTEVDPFAEDSVPRPAGDASEVNRIVEIGRSGGASGINVKQELWEPENQRGAPAQLKSSWPRLLGSRTPYADFMRLREQRVPGGFYAAAYLRSECQLAYSLGVPAFEAEIRRIQEGSSRQYGSGGRSLAEDLARRQRAAAEIRARCQDLAGISDEDVARPGDQYAERLQAIHAEWIKGEKGAADRMILEAAEQGFLPAALSALTSGDRNAERPALFDGRPFGGLSDREFSVLLFSAIETVLSDGIDNRESLAGLRECMAGGLCDSQLRDSRHIEVLSGMERFADPTAAAALHERLVSALKTNDYRRFMPLH